MALRNSYYYPDVVVSCSAESHSHVVERPCLIVEVMSGETAPTDRREKREAYRAIPSLREYLIVEQSHPAVVVRRRDLDGWIEETLDLEDSAHLGCLNLDLPVSAIYAGVVFDPPLQAEP